MSNRVLMIGLDAAESSLVEEWTDDGTLPNLARLRERGAYGRLRSSAELLAGSPWPTFFTGTSPDVHGLYHFLQWRPGEMTFRRPTPDWCDLRPFWRDLGAHGKRAVVLDVPMTFAPEPFDGVEISGWATHDRLAPPASHPPSLLEEIRAGLGEPPVDEEEYGPLPVAALLALRDQLLGATELVSTLARDLMAREAWDLFLVGFGATHRGGHKFWGDSSVEGGMTAPERDRFGSALRDLYVASDRAVGELVEAAGDDTTALVFSLHGMGPNRNRSELLPAMLDRILSDSDGTESESRTPLQRLRGLVPLSFRTAVKSRLPRFVQDRLTVFWRAGAFDWSRTPAFSLEADLQGYVRINRRGREAEGIVDDGPEAEALLAKISEGLRTFRDEDSGLPIVEDVLRVEERFGNGPRRGHLPDLIVPWVDRPVTEHRAIVSPRYGRIPWPRPGGIPDGRSGNHRPEGFLFAAGDDRVPGSSLEGLDIRDLAPLAQRALGVPVADRGRNEGGPGA